MEYNNLGLFNLTGFEEAAEDDVMNLNINETTEFVDGCPTSPDSVKHKEEEIDVPNKVELDDKTYNAALEQLKKSFTEAADLINMLQGSTIKQGPTMEEQYQAHMESAQDAAFLEFAETVIYEAVKKEDKEDIKKIRDDIQDDVKKFIKKQNYNFYVPKVWARAILGTITIATGIPIGAAAATAGWSQIIGTRLWQVLGNVIIEDGQVNVLVKALNEKFSNELGDYKIIEYKFTPTIGDMFKAKMGWKNKMNVYMLLIDKKLPLEIKKINELAEKESEKITESFDAFMEDRAWKNKRNEIMDDINSLKAKRAEVVNLLGPNIPENLKNKISDKFDKKLQKKYDFVLELNNMRKETNKGFTARDKFKAEKPQESGRIKKIYDLIHEYTEEELDELLESKEFNEWLDTI